MQYIWQWRLYGSPDKQLTDGRHICILDPGRLNTDSGPDFFNAKVRIDGIDWAGNVELHLRASDWHRHGHHNDRAYDSVILHVVGQHDSCISRPDGSTIPQLLMPFTRETAACYSTLCEQSVPLRCAAGLSKIPRLHIIDWIDTAAMERLIMKSKRVHDILKLTGGDWARTTLIIIARALGFGLNGDPFEQLAKHVPLPFLARHSDNIFQIEAIFFGVAGLLDEERDFNPYFRALRQEYIFLAHKYSLKHIPPHLWKMSRTRPANSPYRRIALLAHYATFGSTILSRMLDCHGNIEQLRDLFTHRFEGYWATHYNFSGESSRPAPSGLSAKMLDTLILNVVAPVYYAYGSINGSETLHDEAEKLLLSLPAEDNSIIRLWETAAGVTAANAFESQGLLQVRLAYCDCNKCLQCRLGHKLMRHSAGIRNRTGSVII